MSAAIVQKIVSEQSLTTLRDFLKKSTPESLASVTNGDPLDQLNPGIKSLGYLFILKARFQHPASIDSGASLAEKAAIFLQEFDVQQVKLVPTEFHDLVTIFTSLCDLELRAPILALRPLKTAIHRYSRSPSSLTNIHNIFIRQCLLSRFYDDALAILEIPIDDLDTETELHYRHYLLYFYYGSLIYIALKEYSKALDFARFVITAPSAACSAIQLEAFKKYILVSLILNGKMPSPAIPPTVSQPVARAFKYLARPYAELAESLNKDEALSECLITHDAEYVRDQNLGLIQQVLDRREMIKISKLQDTYVAISLEDVAKKVCPSEPSPEDIQRMESVIVRMIDDGELNATISESPPIVTFFSDTSIPSRSEYEKVLSSITAINARLKKLDRSVGLSPSYIKRVKPPGGQGNVSPTDADDAKDAKWTSMREPESSNEKRGKGRKGSVTDMRGNKFPNGPFDVKLED